MPATISVCQNYGWASASYFGEVAKNISNLLSIDDGIANKLDYPITKPTSGTVYSFETWIRLRCDSAPAALCHNFKAWYDSGMPAVGQKVTVNTTVVNTYAQPVNTLSVQGTRDDFIEHDDEASAIDLDGDLVSVGEYTSWLVFQLEITNLASIGSYGLDYTIQYDEV